MIRGVLGWAVAWFAAAVLWIFGFSGLLVLALACVLGELIWRGFLRWLDSWQEIDRPTWRRLVDAKMSEGERRKNLQRAVHRPP